MRSEGCQPLGESLPTSLSIALGVSSYKYVLTMLTLLLLYILGPNQINLPHCMQNYEHYLSVLQSDTLLEKHQ